MATQGFVCVPEDLVIEILYSLPVKSITRFKSLSKHYSTLLESHIVVTKHLRLSSLNNPSLLFRRYFRPPITNTGIALIDNKPEPTDVYTPFACDSPNTKIVGSCNGIVCISLSPADDNLLTWNPATKQIRPIPPPLISLSSPPQGTSLNRISIGFGFDRDVTGYKIIRIVYFRKEVTSQFIPRVEIFSEGLGFWKEMDSDGFTDLTLVKICERSPLVFLDGVIHFEAIGLSDLGDRQYIVSFDVRDETFTKVPVPNACNDALFWCLFTWRETLTVFVHQWGNCPTTQLPGTYFELWRLNESGVGVGGGGGEPWTKLFVIGPFAEITTPIGIWRGSEVVMQMEGIGDDFLFCYDLDSNQRRHLQIDGARFVYEAHDYVESLVQV